MYHYYLTVLSSCMHDCLHSTMSGRDLQQYAMKVVKILSQKKIDVLALYPLSDAALDVLGVEDVLHRAQFKQLSVGVVRQNELEGYHPIRQFNEREEL